jgi:hypothetical protein
MDGSADVALFATVAPGVSGEQQGRSISANSSQAGLFNMHLEEYLARSADCDLPFPQTEFDGLLYFLYMAVIAAFGAGQNDNYCRMCRGMRDLAAQGVLIFQHTALIFGEAGDLREVPTPAASASPHLP